MRNAQPAGHEFLTNSGDARNESDLDLYMQWLGFAMLPRFALLTALLLHFADATVAQVRVIRDDATSQFVPLAVGKSIVIELPAEARDVLVADPAVANVVMRTARRGYVLGIGPGQTSIEFYDAGFRRIEALSVTVQNYPVPATSFGPERVVTIFRGPQGWLSLSCTNSSDFREGAACYARQKPEGTLDSLPSGSSVTMPVGGK